MMYGVALLSLALHGHVLATEHPVFTNLKEAKLYEAKYHSEFWGECDFQTAYCHEPTIAIVDECSHREGQPVKFKNRPIKSPCRGDSQCSRKAGKCLVPIGDQEAYCNFGGSLEPLSDRPYRTYRQPNGTLRTVQLKEGWRYGRMWP